MRKTVREPYYDGPDLKNANLRLPQKLKPVEGGNKFDLGGYQYEVLETPGHTPGSIVLLDSENRILIAGDSIVSTPILILMTIPQQWRNTIKVCLNCLKEKMNLILFYRDTF